MLAMRLDILTRWYQLTIIKITAICFDPDEADFWDGKGVALQKLGKDKEAKDCFDKAEQLK